MTFESGRTTGCIRVECLSSVGELQQLREQWDGLLSSSVSDTPFLTWNWIRTWWEVYGEDHALHLLVARNGTDQILGVAPLKRSWHGPRGPLRSSLVEFVGTGGDVTPEYLDVIVRRGWEERVVPAMADHLLADPKVHGIDLHPFNAGSPNLGLLQRCLGDGGSVRVSSHSVCPVASLPGTWAEFVRLRSRNFRKKMGEYERRCRRDLDLSFRRTESPDDVSRDLESLARLHHARWNGGSQAFVSSRYQEFHLGLARGLSHSDRLRFYFMLDGDREIASLYCFRHGDDVYYYQSGRDPGYAPHRIGLVLMNEAIRDSINEDAACFDFLRGTEDYKYHWADAERLNVRLTYGRTRASRLKARIAMALERFLHPRAASGLGRMFLGRRHEKAVGHRRSARRLVSPSWRRG